MDDGPLNVKDSSPILRGISDAGDSMQDCFDSMLCFPGSRLVLSGLREADCRDDIVMVVNAGGDVIKGQSHQINFQGDSFFEGGDIISSDEKIIEGGDYSCLYQSVRYGNFCYTFNNLDPGDYSIDLHFAEIVYTNGPKGIRVFDVFLQEEKILSGMDIYAIVGANKPLQLVDVRISVAKDDVVVITFKGISGPPMVCGICIRNAPISSGGLENQICNNCASEIIVSPTQSRVQSFSMKLTSRYEKKIQELTSQYKLKNDECHQAWMLLTSANEQLEQLRMDLDNKLFQTETLEQAVERHTDNFRLVSGRYEHDKKLWVGAIDDLEGKIKAMKQEHTQLSQEAHECASSIPDLNKMLTGVETLVAQCEDLKIKYSEELARRKRLYNQVQEMKGNIRVFCRCRPLSKEEVSSGYTTIVDFDGAKDGDIGILTGGSTKRTFKFDRVYAPRDGQGDVYADASPLVASVLDGYNVCIFAYGQTGTGKTFTMEGTEQNRGVNYRTLEELFKIAAERKESISYSISVSVLEVYNEQIRDLLATSPSSKKLEVRQAAEGFHHVPGIVEAKVENIKEVWDVLQAGSNARAVGSNNVNEHSSRSHCMLCIMVKAKNLMNGECTRSKLWLVDLAGSERLAKTDVQGERLKEAQNINRSLSALGDVISALAAKSSHVPYRNSKLTHLLQDSLGGDSKTLMFVQISPSENDMGETLSSLNFASRVRGIELGPAKKQIDPVELQKIKQMLEKVRQESRIKDESIRKLEENCQNLENKLRGKDQLCRNLQEKNKELEGQLESKVELQNFSERQQWQLSEKLKGKEELCMTLQQKVKELENKMKEQQHSELLILQQKVYSLFQKKKKRLGIKFCTERHLLMYQSIVQYKVLELQLKEKLRTEMNLEQKVLELECKLIEREQQSESMILLKTADDIKAVPPSRESSASEIDPQILRCSDTTNRASIGQSSILLRGTESLHEIKRKRELRSGANGESENRVSLPIAMERKTATVSDMNKSRKIDPAKAFGRITRASKVSSTTQKLFSHSRTGKDQDKTKMWSR
ncbi:hypothetical protein J5N97_019046 [Dioscorea zingiberensis]|uniref:Kinesin motor domain-containing protein n=1 Tax=Dioscorea zingiberensis TaxID=325984 RepID=A0A9D5HCC3_9LILI|nr:hypothetical protein J5N97_019046 [Dioscorea zingiberensis]